jgi:hypothetical protein
MELLYTFRGADDAELQTRIKDTLPLFQDIMEACEERTARRAAEREAAQAAQAQPSTGAPADLQALLQQAVQQALAVQAPSTSTAPATDQARSTPAPAAPGSSPAATGATPFCQAHQAPLELRTNERGSWWSHWVASEKRYCKGE